MRSNCQPTPRESRWRSRARRPLPSAPAPAQREMRRSAHRGTRQLTARICIPSYSYEKSCRAARCGLRGVPQDGYPASPEQLTPQSRAVNRRHRNVWSSPKPGQRIAHKFAHLDAFSVAPEHPPGEIEVGPAAERSAELVPPDNHRSGRKLRWQCGEPIEHLGTKRFASLLIGAAFRTFLISWQSATCS